MEDVTNMPAIRHKERIDPEVFSEVMVIDISKNIRRPVQGSPLY
jgi:hypothetical protein